MTVSNGDFARVTRDHESLGVKEGNKDFLLPGPACAFPFTYKGKKYYMCTRKNSILLWCSLDTEYQGNWKFCTEKGKRAACLHVRSTWLPR